MDSYHVLAAHILRALAISQEDEDSFSTPTLESLTEELEVRRADVRTTLSELHREGLVDVARMRLTMTGLALATAFTRSNLAPIRRNIPLDRPSYAA
jgi:Mn-dependent DtxR family transcriptional regulator